MRAPRPAPGQREVEAPLVVTAGLDDPALRGVDHHVVDARLAADCLLRHHPRREWCSAGCGNRARVVRHHRRHHTRAADPG